MAGNLKPANVGSEVVVTDVSSFTYSNQTNAQRLFDGQNTIYDYNANYVSPPFPYYIQFTAHSAFNLWALPAEPYGNINGRCKLQTYNGSEWVDYRNEDAERGTVIGTWYKVLTSVPAGTYRWTYANIASSNNRTDRSDGEWYFEEAQTTAPSVPINLTAAAGNTQVVLNWSAVTSATGYNVKRATVTGGPYTTIASNVQGTTYTDAGLTNGTKYYYVVTAVNASGESGNSNEASATPTGGVVPSVTDKAFLLTVEMREEIQRVYVLSAAKLNEFVAWYTARSAGTGPAYCIVEKPFNRKDYMAFSEIVTFEVADYSK